jgi:phospholipid transport system substrate-binding protein
MVPRHLTRVATFTLAVALTFAPRAEPVSAAQVVDRFHATLLDAMKNAQALGVEGRLARIEPVMVETYDFPAMAQRSLGPGWAKLDETQRARFERVFRDLILRTYATRFNAYTSERFETRGTEASIAGTEIVRTVLHSPKQTVQLDYRMRETPAGWRVIDVYLGGTVSELALRRAEYTSVLERDGFDALVSALQSKGAEGPTEVPASSDSLVK